VSAAKSRKQRSSGGRRSPLVQVSVHVQRRQRRRGGILRSIWRLLKVIMGGEPVTRTVGGSGMPRSARSSSRSGRATSARSSGGRGAPIRSAGWQGPDPYGAGMTPDRGGTGGRRIPWSSRGADDDPFMAEMEAAHGVDRWGQPIQGHPRWSTPEGRAELETAIAASETSQEDAPAVADDGVPAETGGGAT
jgi:hypothetical protein